MYINSIRTDYSGNKTNQFQTSSFKGLLGRKIGYAEKIVELREVDRYYPFKGESSEKIKAAIKHIKSLKFNKFGKGPFATGEINVEEVLPFTKEEWVAYKSKNGARLKEGLLTKKDEEIDRFLALNTGHGLCSSYKNKYKKAFMQRIIDLLRS